MQVECKLSVSHSTSLTNSLRFLWATLKLKHLCTFNFERGLDDALNDVSIEPLEKLLSRIFDEITAEGPTTRKLVIDVFSWVLSAKEALSADALISALDIQNERISTANVLHMCRSLLTKDTTTGALEFCHASIQEFVNNQLQVLQIHPDVVTAMYCIKTCEESSGISDMPPSPSKEMLRYSVTYWAEYYLTAIDADHSGEFANMVHDFVFDESELSATFSQWILDTEHVLQSIGDYYGRNPALQALSGRVDTPFFMCCTFGMEEILAKAIDYGIIDLNDVNKQGLPGLYLASAYGYSGVVRLLLAKGADAAIKGGKHGSPFQVACAYGNMDVVKILCEHLDMAQPGSTLMDGISVSIDRTNDNVAAFLISSWLDSLDEEHKEIIFNQAAVAGSIEVLNVLRNDQQIPAISPSPTKKALVKACRRGKTGPVKSLISSMSEDEIKESNEAVAAAATFDHCEIIRILVNAGLALNTQHKTLSPLYQSALHGHIAATNTLIELSTSKNEPLDYADALQVASRKGHVLLVEALIAAGADVNDPSGGYGSALQAAASAGQIEVTRILLKHGADPSQGGRFDNSYEAAIKSANYPILQIFDEAGCLPSRYQGSGKRSDGPKSNRDGYN